MKKVYFVFLSLMVSTLAFGQETNIWDIAGYWTDHAIWTDGSAPSQSITTDVTIVQNSVSNPKEGARVIIPKIQGVNTGNLTVDGTGNIITTLTVNGFLIIEGDLTLGNNAKLNIGPKGILLIKGAFTSSPHLMVESGGIFIVNGSFTMLGNDNQGSFTNNGELYLNDPNKVNSGATNNEDFDQLKLNHRDLYDLATSTYPTPMPVNLLYFKAKAQQQSVEINWASSKAWDFSHYELERSADGVAFEYVATIDAEENTNRKVEYSYSDRQPLFGTSYYRLKAVDVDGSFEYKELAGVKFGAESFKVYPNPSSLGYINIAWSHATEGSVLNLKDSTGRTVRSAKISGTNQTISTEGLTAGIYLLSVQGAAGIQQTQVLVR